MNKAYNKITWQNKPSTATPLNQTNLNEMSNALDTIDDRVIALDSGKVSSVTVTNTLQTGDTIATITVDGTATNIKSAQVEVDAEPSATSENPLQNKAIYEMLNNLLPEETAEGNPIAISDASGLNAKACSVDLLPIQDLSHGEPSPTNICPITGRDSVKLVRTGKNLFNPSAEVVNAYVTVGGAVSTSSTDRTVLLPIIPNSTYTFTWNREATSGNDDSKIAVFTSKPQIGGSAGRALTSITTSGASVTFTSSASECWIAVKIANTTKSDVTETIKASQLELGSTATAYEPYQGETYTETLGQTVYGGNVDFVSGKLTIDSLIAILNGTEGWTKYQSTNRYYADGLSFRGLLDINRTDSISNEFSFGGYITSMAGASTEGKYYLQNNVGRVAINSDKFSTASELETYLSTNNLQIVFPLATPIEITLTPEQISLLKGINVISTDGDNINLVYSADIKAWVENQLQS